jgi:hypothetical protein
MMKIGKVKSWFVFIILVVSSLPVSALGLFDDAVKYGGKHIDDLARGVRTHIDDAVRIGTGHIDDLVQFSVIHSDNLLRGLVHADDIARLGLKQGDDIVKDFGKIHTRAVDKALDYAKSSKKVSS